MAKKHYVSTVFCETCTLIQQGYSSDEIGVEDCDVPKWDSRITFAAREGYDEFPTFTDTACGACGDTTFGDRYRMGVELSY